MSALRPALFFDRDGVLNADDGGYTHRVEDLAWMPGAKAAVKAANDAGWLTVVVTNQSGVGRGYYTPEHVEAFHAAMTVELADAGARIDGWYACFHHPEAVYLQWRHPDHPDRKPNPGMLLRAADELGIDLTRSVLIGDRGSDVEAARRAGAGGVLFKGGDLESVVKAAIVVAPDAAP